MILERFSNPAVGDQIQRICGDGLSKLPIFLSPTTREVLASGQDPSVLACHLACFRACFSGKDDYGREIPVSEPHLKPNDAKRLASEDPLEFLAIAPFAPLELAANPRFRERFLHFVGLTEKGGAAAALADLLAD